MSNLLLAPPEVIQETRPHQWHEASAGAVLFTAQSPVFAAQLFNEELAACFTHVEFFEHYATSDYLEKRALELHAVFEFEQVTGLTRTDWLRAVRLRNKLGIPGQTLSSARIFHNKYLLKETLAAKRIPVPFYQQVNNTIELLNFIAAIGYPILLKPLSGYGAEHILIIENEMMLNYYLVNGLFSHPGKNVAWLAEEFVHGDFYHINGLVLDKKCTHINAAKYINNPLKFINGAILASYTLENTNPLKARLTALAEKVLLEALPTPAEALFHIEVFHTARNELVISDVSLYTGQPGVNNQMLLADGIDLKMSFIKSQCLKQETLVFAHPSVRSPVVARLLIPPKLGHTLISLPQHCPLEWVTHYAANGIVGKNYQRANHAPENIGFFLLQADSEKQVINRIYSAFEWMHEEMNWL